jgi:hypothetical protein
MAAPVPEITDIPSYVVISIQREVLFIIIAVETSHSK